MSKLLEQINTINREMPIGELCSAIFSGGTPSTTNPKFWNGAIPWLSSGETRQDFINETEKKITKDGVENSSTRLALKNDVVIATAGQGLTRGQASFLNIDTYINQSLISLRANPSKLESHYLYYYLKSRYKKLRSLSDDTSSRGSITIPILSRIKINLPDISIQKKIAEILSAYDSKIENNNKIIKNLELTAQTIFDEWFINFRFPGYEKVKMTESELGEVPEGWSVGKIKDLIKVESGFPFSSSIFDDSGKYKLVTIRNVQDGSFVTDCDNLIAELPSKLPKHCSLVSGDILLSLTGNVGRICLVNGENYVLNQRVSVLIPVNERDRAYTYFLFRRNDFQNLLISISKGTAQLNLSPVETKELEAIIPENSTLRKYSEIATPMYKKIVEINSENVNLKQSRDQLLAKLI